MLVSSKVPDVTHHARPSKETGPQWKRFGDYQYMFVSDRKTWKEAREFCLAQGADLASIHSTKENEFLYDLVKLPKHIPHDELRARNFQRDQYVWIGLRKINGEWSWSDCTSVDYVNWEPYNKEPNNFIEPENCAEMEAHEDFAGGWADVGCETLVRGFVCKKPPMSF